MSLPAQRAGFKLTPAPAVELAAKPSLLFFLDEPTSGLDGQVGVSGLKYTLTTDKYLSGRMEPMSILAQARFQRPGNLGDYPSTEFRTLVPV